VEVKQNNIGRTKMIAQNTLDRLQDQANKLNVRLQVLENRVDLKHTYDAVFSLLMSVYRHIDRVKLRIQEEEQE
jgi:hypothetical protein